MKNFLFVIVFMLLICQVVYGEEYKGEYYEKNGCIYLTGNLTKEEKTRDLEYYNERISARGKQINNELYRRHDIEIEKIRAKALENYLIAQSLDYGKITETIKRRRRNTSVNIGNITSQSSVGDITSNADVGDIINTNTTDNLNTSDNTNSNVNK